MEVWKVIGASFGYVLSAISLITMIVGHFRNKLSKFVKNEAKADEYKERMERVEKLLEAQSEETKRFRADVMTSLKYQEHASKQTLANIIETTYYSKRAEKRLDPIELKRITNAYAIYHDELNGNSYVAQIYDEMMNDWVHE